MKQIDEEKLKNAKKRVKMQEIDTKFKLLLSCIPSIIFCEYVWNMKLNISFDDIWKSISNLNNKPLHIILNTNSYDQIENWLNKCLESLDEKEVVISLGEYGVLQPARIKLLDGVSSIIQLFWKLKCKDLVFFDEKNEKVHVLFEEEEFYEYFLFDYKKLMEISTSKN